MTPQGDLPRVARRLKRRRARPFLFGLGLFVGCMWGVLPDGRAATGSEARAGAAGESGSGGAEAAEEDAAPLAGGSDAIAEDSSSVEQPEDERGSARTLPPFEPEPSVAPVFATQKDQPGPEARAISPGERPSAVIKTVVGLLALLALAYLGGHARVLKLEERLGISQVITAGFPFIVLGMVARLPSVGILTDPVLTELSPLLRIGLGSIGLIAGFRFDTRRLQAAPPGTATIALLSTLLPAAVVVGVMAPVLLLLSDDLSRLSLSDPVFIRDALILGTAGAMTARSAARGAVAGVAGHVIRLEAVAGIAGVAAVASFFRAEESDGTWQLPGVGWLLLSIGLGASLGLLFYAILQTTERTPEFLVVTLGSISFAAGAAGYLNLSSVAVAFVAGVMLTNFPGTYHERLQEMLLRIERPIYFLSLFVIGALWQVGDLRGWALMPLFMAARLVGKWLASVLAAKHPSLPVDREQARLLAVSPLGALAIAIVVNAQLLYPGGSISLIVSAVIGGGVLTEIFVQLANRRWFRAQKRGEFPSNPEEPGLHSAERPSG